MNKSLAYALPLVVGVNGEVCEIGNIAKVREGARDTDQALSMPGRDNEIGIFEHALEYVRPIQGASLTKSRAFVEVDGGRYGDLGVVMVFDVHTAETRVLESC